MNTGYEPGAWIPMYAAVAGSAAAFAGLLFVALTVNLPRILPDAAHVARAREALGGLLTLLVTALLVLLPGQPATALGIELVCLAALLVAVSIRFQGQTIRRLPAERRTRWAMRTLPINLGTAAIIAAGVSLIAAAGGGLYWLAATVVIYFLWSALNAWVLVVQAADTTRGR